MDPFVLAAFLFSPSNYLVTYLIFAFNQYNIAAPSFLQKRKNHSHYKMITDTICYYFYRKSLYNAWTIPTC